MLKEKWRVQECFAGSDCWCSTIFSNQKDEDGDDKCIISSGSMPKQYGSLIASAPEILEALITILGLNILDDYIDCDVYKSIVKKALE